jgi:lipopolysaccharide export system protein LptA
MRRVRPLILLLIAVVVAVVGATYLAQKSTQAREAPQKPAALPATVNARADQWTWSYNDGTRRVVDVIADHFQAVEEGSHFDLKGVELHLFHKDGTAFDKVRSVSADFDVGGGVLYSKGPVDITMNVPADSTAKPGRLVVIKTSGVRFESKTGKATTDQFAHFTFDRGEGQSVGAQYDPATRELQMFKAVKLTWRGSSPEQKPMEIETGNLIYRESESKVLLTPWSTFRRATLSLKAAGSVVTLNDGSIELVEALNAQGVDKQPSREVEYAADQLLLRFGPDNVVQSITGDRNASLLSRTDTAHTKVNADRLDLEFDLKDGESLLRTANANGRGVVESKPVARPNFPLSDTRVLRADSIALAMRPGGEEIEKVETHSAGEIEFLPNRPGQKQRQMAAERLSIGYGARNQVQSFRAFNAKTRTQAEALPGKPAPPPALTSSRELSAEFDQTSGDLSKLEQWDDFRYDQGDQHATSGRAVLENPTDRITLTGVARVWDSTGSTAADTIVMNQKTNDFEAIGNVVSTRMPDKKQKDDALLSGDEPVQAKAARMTSTDGNRKIRYETDVLLWQGANRIEAAKIDIDRTAERLEARGNVLTQLVDESKQKPPGKPVKKTAPIFTTVSSPEMDYSDKDRLAHYRGGAVLKRPGMNVDAQEIRAFLQKTDSGSNLDKAFADGAVKIVQNSPGRTRVGTAGHAEYYAAEGKVILQQSGPQLVDSVRGSTKGKQLTYFSNNDRLLVEGAENEPIKSRVIRR